MGEEGEAIYEDARADVLLTLQQARSASRQTRAALAATGAQIRCLQMRVGLKLGLSERRGYLGGYGHGRCDVGIRELPRKPRTPSRMRPSALDPPAIAL